MYLNKKSNHRLIPYYYLLYQLKNIPIFWIVKKSDVLYELKDHIKNFTSKIEKYYIIAIDEDPLFNTLSTKQFDKIVPDTECDILYETELY